MNNQNNIKRFIEESLLAQDDVEVGYMARGLVQATMPHSKPKSNSYIKVNGDYTLTIQGNPLYGLPYGTIPRLLMSWITTEAVRTKSRKIELGKSLRTFMNELGLAATGGKNGTIMNLKDQMQRLFSCSMSLIRDKDNHFNIQNITPIDGANIFWSTYDSPQLNRGSLITSTVTLGERFFNEIVSKPVVFRLKTLKLLKQSSLAVDLYIWITYRNSYSTNISHIPWRLLQLQFGAGYPDTLQGKRDFKKKFIAAIKKVAVAYPEANKIRIEQDKIIFIPGNPDIPKLKIVSS
jgi:hypothetical protein